MTAREKKVVLIVGVATVLILGYNFIFGLFAPSTPSDTDEKLNVDLNNAYRLIRQELNIIAWNKHITAKLDKLQAMFHPKAKAEEAGIALLKEAELIAAACNLNVQQKNIVRYSDTLIGVTLDGKSSPESLIKFMHRITTSRFGLKISRLQIHTLNDQKMLDYQIAVSSLLL